jgi:hypothetical protein
MAEAAEVEGDGETRRQLEDAVAWLRANGRPELDIGQARREALHDWLGAQWAEHNRSEPFPTCRSGAKLPPGAPRRAGRCGDRLRGLRPTAMTPAHVASGECPARSAPRR